MASAGIDYIIKKIFMVPFDGNIAGKGEICNNCRTEVKVGWTSCQNCQAKRVMYLTPLGDRIESFPDKITSRYVTFFLLGSLLVGMGFFTIYMDDNNTNHHLVEFFIISGVVIFALAIIPVMLYPVMALLGRAWVLEKKLYTVEYKKD